MTVAFKGKAADVDDLRRICRKAFGYPIKGSHVGGGRHVVIPDWDGEGPPPPGWTDFSPAYTGGSDDALPIADREAAELGKAGKIAGLTGQEKATLAAGLAARVETDFEAGGYVPRFGSGGG